MPATSQSDQNQEQQSYRLEMARGGLTALGTRGRGPRSGRAWSAQRHSETERGEPIAETPGRHICGKTSGQLSPRRLLSNISSDIPSTNRNQQQLDFVRKKGVFYGQVSQNDNSSVKRYGFTDKRGLGFPGQSRGFTDNLKK